MVLRVRGRLTTQCCIARNGIAVCGVWCVGAWCAGCGTCGVGGSVCGVVTICDAHCSL